MRIGSVAYGNLHLALEDIVGAHTEGVLLENTSISWESVSALHRRLHAT